MSSAPKFGLRIALWYATLFVAGTSIFGMEDLPRAYRRLVQELA